MEICHPVPLRSDKPSTQLVNGAELAAADLHHPWCVQLDCLTDFQPVWVSHDLPRGTEHRSGELCNPRLKQSQRKWLAHWPIFGRRILPDGADLVVIQVRLNFRRQHRCAVWTPNVDGGAQLRILHRQQK
jgi:hypothetical protein